MADQVITRRRVHRIRGSIRRSRPGLEEDIRITVRGRAQTFVSPSAYAPLYSPPRYAESVTDQLTLTATLRPATLDARRGIVRLHPEVIIALGLRTGDPVTLAGRRTTAGLVAVAAAGSSRALLYADDLLLGNLGIRDGGQVTITPAPVVAATRIDVAGPAELQAAVSPDMLRLALLGKVVSVGDDVSLLPQDVLPAAGVGPLLESARASLRNTVGFAWTSALVTVVACDPAHACLVTMDTVVGWHNGQFTHSTETPWGVRPAGSPVAPGTPASAPLRGYRAGTPESGASGIGVADSGSSGSGISGLGADPGSSRPGATRLVPDFAAPSVDDLPGMRKQAEELTELLDLGFHHGEVLGRLGTTITLGILVTGPAGSGKSALVRAVAAQVHASVTTIWAPEIAALTNNDAAGRLRAAASSAASSAPAVLLISDVETLIPRDGSPGPLTTVFRQLITDTLRAGVAVVCTTGRPESVDPSLRAPGTLDHEIAVPLPDASGRREQLGVLTRQVPLAADLHLDDIAARTPGFVTADLAALTREAGVRAALRQRSNVDAPTVGLVDFDAALEVVRPTSMADSLLELAKVTLDDVGDMATVKEMLTESVLWPLTYPDTFARLGVEPPRGVLLYGPPGCGKTFLVKAIAGTGKANVLSVKGAELLSKWVGDSEAAVRALFRRARDAAPSLVFLDEVDALAPIRGQSTDGGTTDRVVAALLTELDGVEPMRNVVVIGATNRPDLVDPALLRPGRLERLVYVPPPDGAARTEILRAASRSVPLDPDVDISELGAALDGFSAADCTALVREAALAAMRKSLDAATVSAADVESARSRVRASLDPAQVAALAAYAGLHTAG
jgi:transitional endoplasmic reticulum ATPase